MGVALGCNVNVSIGSLVGIALGSTAGVGAADSSIGDGPLCWKGVDAASCARTNGEAAKNAVAIASKRMVVFRLFPYENH
jgi:hypothetical protein